MKTTTLKELQARRDELLAAYHEASDKESGPELAKRTAEIKAVKQAISMAIIGNVPDCPICKQPPQGVEHQGYDRRRRKFEIDTPDGKRPVDGTAFDSLSPEVREKAHVLDRGVFPTYEVGCTGCPLGGDDEDIDLARLKWARQVENVAAALQART